MKKKNEKNTGTQWGRKDLEPYMRGTEINNTTRRKRKCKSE